MAILFRAGNVRAFSPPARAHARAMQEIFPCRFDFRFATMREKTPRQLTPRSSV
jgi:hypothetical protein